MRGGKKGDTLVLYNCPYILRTKEVCNQKCYHPKGCKVYRNSRQVACKKSGCEEMTKSKYDYCDTHAKKHRSKEHYHRKKLTKQADGLKEIPLK